MLDEIEKLLNNNYPMNQGFFIFGSYVYKTKTEVSDIDLVVIEDNLSGQTVIHDNLDIQFISKKEFIDNLNSCDIKALECLFTDEKRIKFKVYKEAIDWSNLRAAISQKSSHSWVKAKKKLIDGEAYIGKKSLFHSLRIISFGIQLAKDKKITNFQELSHLYNQILTGADNWEILLAEHKSLYNSLHSQFKALQPKKS